MALATDSALSAPVDLLDELAVARRVSAAGAPLRNGHQRAGADSASCHASARRLDRCPHAGSHAGRGAASRAAVALVVVAGRIRLISPDLARQLPAAERRALPTAARGRAARPCWWMPTSARCAAPPRNIWARNCASRANGSSHEPRTGASAHPGAGAAQPLQLPLRHVRHLEASPTRSEITAAELERHLADIERLGVEWVVFTGGEPLMHSDLFRLSALLRAPRHPHHHSEHRPAAGTQCRRGLSKSTDEVIVSLDGPERGSRRDSPRPRRL